MANLKIDEYNGSNSFTFPYNPTSVEMITTKFIDQRTIPYHFTFLGMGDTIRAGINVSLNGHFDGATKNSNYRELVAIVNSPTLQEIYFENSNDKFYLGTGVTIQKVPTGARPLHVDYVASFFCPFGMLFGATQKSGSSSSSESNAGDVETPIEEITGSVSSGVAVTIEDKDGNGFTFTPNATGTMTYKLVEVVSTDNTVYIVEYFYVTVGSTVQIIKNADVSGDIMLKLGVGESLNDIFTGGTISGITPTFRFRDGWASD